MRRNLQKGIFSAVLASLTVYLILTAGCSPAKTERYTAVMGTILTVTIYDMPQDRADAAIEAVFQEMNRLNTLMSLWDDKSSLSRLNRAASSDWAVADPEIYALLKDSLRYSRLTDGAFDVTAGPLVRLWGFLRRNHRRLPTSDELAEATARCGYLKVETDDSRKAVRFSADSMEIDFGGIAKGYAVDSAVKLLRERGVTSALVNLGGNSLSIGTPPGRPAWRLAVRDPRSAEGTIGVLELKESGVAGSGQYENYFEVDGKRYGHIIDPRTGYPVEGVLGTTIVAPDAITADILSTAVFVLGPDKGPAFTKSQKGIRGIVILPRADGGLLIKISAALKPSFQLDASVTDAAIEAF
jgi:thiamine biosynthesis lipoprotein